jgi:class 3 adenylate cyclase/tetratricopeptide (TPR) repeat protein
MDCYVPRLLRERLAAPEPLLRPEARDVPAAILLSDLQGFTALVERFSEGGRAGLEELTWALNRYFADLVDEVTRHGGDVVSIAGDAFLCAWPTAPGEELADTVARAAAAGLAIQRALHDRDAGRGMRFATRIGVGAGDATIATVGGDEGRWELLLSGEALRDAVAAEHVARAGQVVLSSRAAALVGARASGRRLDDARLVLDALDGAPPGAMPEAPLVSAERLRPHLPLAVLDRQSVPSAEWLAESRGVTVLFSAIPSLADLTGEAEVRLDVTDDAVRDFQSIVRRLEGTVKVDMDDKGTILLAIWGLPPIKHEDDAERAVQAAWALREALASRGLGSGIGLATGRAICGAFGSDRRRDYMVRGDVINLAARLMGVAAGDITCDEATVLATRGRVAVETLAAVSVKGRTAPVAIFRPTARRDRADATLAPGELIVGREHERAKLAAALEAFTEGGDGGVVLIEAEAGLGKSTLAAELARDAIEAGARVLAAVADAIDRATPYYAWRPVFTELFGITGDGDTMAVSKIGDRMRALPQLERLMPLLATVLPLRLGDNALTAEMTGDVRADNTRRLLVALLAEAVRERPTLLVVEDAQWLDSASAALLLDVARELRPALTVVTARPADGSTVGDTTRLRALATAGHLRLAHLGDAETDALVARRLGVTEVPASLLAYVRERVAGHPFFCEELLQAMLAAGVVAVVDGRCRVGDLVALDLPTTVEGVIVSRLDRLSPSQQLCLKIAAVIGRTFRERAVRETHPVPEQAPHVPRHLEDLRTLELTALEAPEPEVSYLFRHVTTRDVTYELMPRAQRQPLHRAVAAWIEREFARDLGLVASLLAWHWAQADDAPRTLTYLEMAGEQALRDGAFTEAATFFADALALAGREPRTADALRQARWHRGLGLARYFLGDLVASQTHLERAVATLDRPVPAAGAATGLSLLRAAARQAVNRTLPGLALGRQAHRKAALDEATDCYRALGQIYYLAGEPAPRLAYLTVRGVNVGEAAGPSPALARVLANMGTLTSLLGFKTWSDWYGAHAATMAESEGQYAAGAYVWHIGALREITNGRIAPALEANAKALTRIQELGDFNLETEAWSVRAMILATAMDCREGPDAAARCIARAQATGSTVLGCWAQLNLVDFALGQGEVAVARVTLDRALAIETRDGDLGSRVLKQRGVALVCAREGRWAEAVEAARTVLAVVRRQPPTAYYVASAVADAAEVLLRAGRAGHPDDALALDATTAASALSRLARNFWHLRARHRTLWGQMAVQLGDAQTARREFERAAAVAASLDQPFERARALRALASLAPAAGGEAAEARTLLARLGAEGALPPHLGR